MTVHYNFLAYLAYGADHTKQQQISVEDSDRYARSLLTIAAADGLSEQEQEYFVNLSRGMGMPDQFADAYANYDTRSTTLEDLLAPIRRGKPQSPIPMLIYDAIRLCSVDGYSAKERAKVEQAARLLGVRLEYVRALEGLVVAEDAVRSARLNVFAAMETELEK